MLQWHSIELRLLPAYQAGDGVFREEHFSQEHWSSARGCRPNGRPRVSEERNAVGRSAGSGFQDRIESGSMRPHGHTKPMDTRRRLNPRQGRTVFGCLFLRPKPLMRLYPLSPALCPPQSECGAGNTEAGTPLICCRQIEGHARPEAPQPSSAACVRRRFIPKQEAIASHTASY